MLYIVFYKMTESTILLRCGFTQPCIIKVLIPESKGRHPRGSVHLETHSVLVMLLYSELVDLHNMADLLHYMTNNYRNCHWKKLELLWYISRKRKRKK